MKSLLRGLEEVKEIRYVFNISKLLLIAYTIQYNTIQYNTIQLLSPYVGRGRPQCPSQGLMYKT